MTMRKGIDYSVCLFIDDRDECREQQRDWA